METKKITLFLCQLCYLFFIQFVDFFLFLLPSPPFLNNNFTQQQTNNQQCQQKCTMKSKQKISILMQKVKPSSTPVPAVTNSRSPSNKSKMDKQLPNVPAVRSPSALSTTIKAMNNIKLLRSSWELDSYLNFCPYFFSNLPI